MSDAAPTPLDADLGHEVFPAAAPLRNRDVALEHLRTAAAELFDRPTAEPEPTGLSIEEGIQLLRETDPRRFAKPPELRRAA